MLQFSRRLTLISSIACLVLSIGLWAQTPQITQWGGDTLMFEETGNVPSSGDAVFASRINGLRFEFLGNRASVMVSADGEATTEHLGLSLKGAAGAGIAPIHALPGRVNYLPSGDPRTWRTNLRTSSGVKYQDVYPGIDLVYYGNRGQLEYDFVVAPQGDPGKIALQIENAREVAISPDGGLNIERGSLLLHFSKPVIYQAAKDGSRELLSGGYIRRNDGTIGFAIPQWDRNRELVIDPVLGWSTFVGVSGDSYYAMAIDSSSNLYLAGRFGGLLVVEKLSPDGKTVIYRTVIGSAYNATPQDIRVDGSGNAYVVGFAGTNFPTTATAFLQNVSSGTHAFVAVVNAAGTALTYASYLAGTTSSEDQANGVAVDGTGKVYITGFTFSTTFPTTAGVYQTTNTNGTQTAFVAKFDPTKSGAASLVYSTLLSGPLGASFENGIAVDGSGNAYVAGNGGSDFPVTKGAFAYNGEGVGQGGVYVTKLNSGATALGYSAYLGVGTANAIALDGNGDAYVTGSVGIEDFPTTTGAYQVDFPGGFATELNVAGSALVYSTFLSGAVESTTPTDIALEPGCLSACNAFVVGYTGENDMGLTLPIQSFNASFANGGFGGNDDFVWELNGTGTAAVFATYVGGSSDDSTGFNGHSPAIAANSTGVAYVVGETSSTDFPVTLTATPQRSYFALEISPTAAATAVVFPTSLNFNTQTVGVASPTMSVIFRNMGSNSMTMTSIVPSPSDYMQTNTCGASLNGGAECTITVTFTPTTSGSRAGTLTITTSGNNSPTVVSLAGTGANQAYMTLTPSSLTYADQLIDTASASQTVTVGNLGNIALTIGAGAIGMPTNYAQTNNCPASLATNLSCTITIAFLPTQAGQITGSMFVSTNSSSPNSSVNLSGVGLAGLPTLTVSTAGLVFDPQVVGTTSVGQNVSVVNTGNVPVVITGSSASGDFAVQGCVVTLFPGGSCNARVTFTPTTTGTRNGTVTLTDSTAAGTHTFTLTGTGVAPTSTLALDPPAVSFPDTAIGATSAAFTVQVTNTSDTAVNITRVSTTGDFRINNTGCVQNLRATGICNISVEFAPTATGARAGTVVLEDAATGSPQTITLSGNGLATAGAAIASPDSVTFANQAVGTVSATVYTITLQDVGNIPFDASKVAFTGTNPGDFGFSFQGCAATILTPGRECQVQITFNPTATGSRTANLTFTNAAGTQVVTLSGTGVAATFSLTNVPTTLTYQAQQKGVGSPTQSVFMINTGTAPITISNIKSGIADYQFFGCTGVTIQPNTSCQLEVTLTPSVTTTDNSTLTVTSNAAGSPQSITVDGSGASAPAAMQLMPGGLQFNQQVVSTSSNSQSVSILNNSGGTVTGFSTSVTGANIADFTVSSNSCTSSLTAGNECGFQVTFKPGATGVRSAAVNVTDSVGTQTVNVSGYGISSTTSAVLEDSALVFVPETVGLTSAQQPATLQNTGSSPISIASVALGGTNMGDFAISSEGCPVSPSLFSAGSTCNVYVTFTPTASGTRTATLTITDNAPGSPRVVGLTGTGVTATKALEITPTTIQFPPQVNATTSSINPNVVVTNTGTAPVNIASVVLGGTNPGDFSIGNSCPTGAGTSLQQGPISNVCTISVSFTPTAAGTRKATITITHGAPGSPTVINLSGTGVAQTKTLLVTPTTLVFDPQVTGTTSAQQTITVTNTGNFQVTFTNVTISTNFALSNSCTGALPANSSCSIGVTFTPTATGAKAGTVTITDDATGGTQKVTISGTGIATSSEILLSQTTVTFDAQAVSTTSTPQSVYYANQGNTTITIGTITQTGTEFSFSGSSCQNGTQVSAGSFCVLRITFTPSAAGARTSTVTITDNAPGSPRKITLNGTGITSAVPEVLLTPNALTFAKQNEGTTSSPQNINLTNNGTSSLTITTITITGTNPGDFAQTNNCVSPLPAGFSCNIAVTFSPTATGTRTATVSVTDSANGSPHTASLTGTGAAGALPVVTLTPPNLSFPNAPLNTLSSQTVTVKNTGTAGLMVSNVTITGTVQPDWAVTNNTCTGTIAVGNSCTITVKFTPSTLEDQTATASLTDNAGNSPQGIPVTGNGALAAVDLSPSSLTFGSQTVGTTSSAQTITLENYGNATLTITSILPVGPFLISANTCGSSLAPGLTCTVSVEFKPVATGMAIGTLVFTDNAGDSPQTVDLSGTGS